MWWTWITWASIGLLCGLFAGNFLPGRRIIIADIILGIGGALLGGWGSVHAIGDATPQTFIISLLVAVFIAAALLWIFGTLIAKFWKGNV